MGVSFATPRAGDSIVAVARNPERVVEELEAAEAEAGEGSEASTRHTESGSGSAESGTAAPEGDSTPEAGEAVPSDSGDEPSADETGGQE